MARPHLTLHFHAQESFGPLLESARAGSEVASIRDGLVQEAPAAERRTLGALLRLANALSTPVMLSLSNERLWRTLEHAAERKALSDGISRGRFVATPTPGLGAELRLLAPFEVADELRLNVDLWRRAMITPPFGLVDRDATIITLEPTDPARTVTALPKQAAARPLLMTLDLTAAEAHGPLTEVLAELTRVLKDRKDVQLVQSATVPAGAIDRLLGSLLQSGGSYPSFHPYPGAFDPTRDGFPLDLARALTRANPGARAIAPAVMDLVNAGFDVRRLDPALARGVLLRSLTRAHRSATAVADHASASFALATTLIELLLKDEKSLAGEARAEMLLLALEIPAALERVIAGVAPGIPAAAVAEAKKAKTRALRSLPKPEEAPRPTLAFLQDLHRACVAATASADLLTTRATGSAPAAAAAAAQAEAAAESV